MQTIPLAATKIIPLWHDLFAPTSNTTFLFGFQNSTSLIQNYLFLYNIFLIIAPATILELVSLIFLKIQINFSLRQ